MENSNTAVPPSQDPAEGILRGDTSLTDSDRADLFDLFHGARDHNELAQKLQPLAVPDDTKRKLWQAKQLAVSAPSPVEKIASAVHAVNQLDPAARELAEQHPNVFKAFLTDGSKG
jgi:hypothetical protein